MSSEGPSSHAHCGSPVHQLTTTKSVESVIRDVGPYCSPNDDGCAESFSSPPGVESIPSVRGTSVDPIDVSSTSSSRHDTSIEASASSERSTGCQTASSCRRVKTVEMVTVSSSSDEESGYIYIDHYYSSCLHCMFSWNRTSLVINLSAAIFFFFVQEKTLSLKTSFWDMLWHIDAIYLKHRRRE